MALLPKIVSVKSVRQCLLNYQLSLMNRLLQQYRQTVLPDLQKRFQITNTLATPRLEKIIVNAGLSKSIQDSTYTDLAVDVLRRITGQQPVQVKARKSISNFKLRAGMVIGAKVTLRGEPMYAFLDKLINVALPRVRDFRGLPLSACDKRGNYSIGFNEHIVFPEISLDEIEKIVGLQVTISTTAETPSQTIALLTGLGFPFEK